MENIETHMIEWINCSNSATDTRDHKRIYC